MNIKKAEAWRNEIENILINKLLIYTECVDGFIVVRPNCKFDMAYTIDYVDGDGSVALSVGGCLVSECENWTIDPNTRTIRATITDIYGNKCYFAWTIQEEDTRICNNYSLMKDARERLWAIP